MVLNGTEYVTVASFCEEPFNFAIISLDDNNIEYVQCSVKQIASKTSQ